MQLQAHLDGNRRDLELQRPKAKTLLPVGDFSMSGVDADELIVLAGWTMGYWSSRFQMESSFILQFATSERSIRLTGGRDQIRIF